METGRLAKMDVVFKRPTNRIELLKDRIRSRWKKEIVQPKGRKTVTENHERPLNQQK